MGVELGLVDRLSGAPVLPPGLRLRRRAAALRDLHLTPGERDVPVAPLDRLSRARAHDLPGPLADHGKRLGCASGSVRRADALRGHGERRDGRRPHRDGGGASGLGAPSPAPPGARPLDRGRWPAAPPGRPDPRGDRPAASGPAARGGRARGPRGSRRGAAPRPIRCGARSARRRCRAHRLLDGAAPRTPRAAQ